VKYNESINTVRQTIENPKNDPFKLKMWFCTKTSLGECKHGPFKKEKARNKHEFKVHGYDK